MLIGQQVTILGAGIGGLAAALACAKRGASVTVLEQAPEITEVGAGLQISPNGWVVLDALGVVPRLTALRGQAVRLRDFRRGAEVFAMPLTRPFHFVHRADLIDALRDAALEAGVTLRLGVQVDAVEIDGDHVHLTLADGSEETHGLSIAADGLTSAARSQLNPKSRPFFTGQVAWRATVPWDGLAPEAHVFMGPGRHLVRYPLRGGALVNIVAVEERDAWAAEGWSHRDEPRHLRQAFADFCPEIRDLLDHVAAPNLWGLFRHPVASNWHRGPLALLGDAAHPTLPFLAQGANMALEDAWALAACLADADEIPQALSRYQALRRPRVARAVEAANDNAKNYHLSPGPYRFAAHGALRLAGRFAPHIVTNRFNWLYDHDVTRIA
ncbi:FAD-dependent monooxygenase [Gymnodinialimonas sp. 2305UL16-5]|uniref:FAD-dependent monooxygenase n=1 Tax=Gymnodinialimonas mytili TaxID=3126503 RepID=UPI0030B6EDCF